MKKLFNISKIYYFPVILLALTFQSCDVLDTFEDKPAIVENQEEFVFSVSDNSGFLEKVYGTNKVKDAVVTFRSVSQDTIYTARTDSNGNARIKGMFSGEYMVSVERKLTEAEIEKNTGNKSGKYKLINRTVKQLSINPVVTKNYLIPLQLGVDAELLISELYMCGPVGSGLYFHDKYIEIYNPSDAVQYLDGILVALVYSSSVYGINYINDPTYIHSTCLWKFPGKGTDYPIAPGEFIIIAEDAMDHRTNAPNSLDLSHANFEFFKDDAPDVDNPGIINMIKIYQKSGNDWISGGKADAVVIARAADSDIIVSGEEMLFPISGVIDGAEYMEDKTRLEKKELTPLVDAGAAGGIQFYVGKSYERMNMESSNGLVLMDNNNSTLDFTINNTPTPWYHYSKGQ